MPFPRFEFAIVCEGIRPEIGNKMTLLGFYGLAPHVEILISRAETPLALAFLMGFAPIAPDSQNERFVGRFQIVGPSSRVLFETPESPVLTPPGPRILLAFAATIMTEVGQHSFRVFVNGTRVADVGFQIRVASPEQLRQAGLPIPH